MSNLFDDLDKFNGDISKWDVSNVTDMSFMFCGCRSFNQPLANWDVSKVTYNSNILYKCPIEEKHKPNFK